jgi:MtN3 and saliva related transmembrane protein
MTLLDVLGYAAASCTTLSFVPQALKVWRTRSADGISTLMYSVFIAGIALWLGYGIGLRSWPIVVANAVTLVLSSSVLVLKLRYARSSPSNFPP